MVHHPAREKGPSTTSFIELRKCLRKRIYCPCIVCSPMLLNTKWLIDRYIWAFNCKYTSGEATKIAGEIYDKWCYMLWGMAIEPLCFWHERQHIGRICNHARSGARRDRIDTHTKPG